MTAREKEACATCGHPWVNHSKGDGCWHGWDHDLQGMAIANGCECLLAHSRLSPEGDPS